MYPSSSVNNIVKKKSDRSDYRALLHRKKRLGRTVPRNDKEKKCKKILLARIERLITAYRKKLGLPSRTNS